MRKAKVFLASLLVPLVLFACDKSNSVNNTKDVEVVSSVSNKNENEMVSRILKEKGIEFNNLKNLSFDEATEKLKDKNLDMKKLFLLVHPEAKNGFKVKFIAPWNNPECYENERWWWRVCLQSWWAFTKMGCDGPCSGRQ